MSDTPRTLRMEQTEDSACQEKCYVLRSNTIIAPFRELCQIRITSERLREGKNPFNDDCGPSSTMAVRCQERKIGVRKFIQFPNMDECGV